MSVSDIPDNGLDRHKNKSKLAPKNNKIIIDPCFLFLEF